jgi:hypothetical protein
VFTTTQATDWKRRLQTLPTGRPRTNWPAVAQNVRSFYLDLAAWAQDDPVRWAPWVAPSPIGNRELRVLAPRRRRRQIAEMNARTRALSPVLPQLISSLAAQLRRAEQRLAAASDGEPLRFLLNTQGSKAGTHSVVLQRDRRAEQRLGLHYRTAFRESGADLVVPSVVHLTVDHFAAVIRREGDRYQLVAMNAPVNSTASAAQLLRGFTMGFLAESVVIESTTNFFSRWDLHLQTVWRAIEPALSPG